MIEEQSTYNRIDNIPPEKRWQPGQSGNPAGRPKDSVTTLLKEKDNQAIADKLYALALAGDMKAIDVFLDRTEGKVSQDVKLEGIVGVLTPQYLETARERLLEAKQKTKELIEGQTKPIIDDAQSSISENEG